MAIKGKEFLFILLLLPTAGALGGLWSYCVSCILGLSLLAWCVSLLGSGCIGWALGHKLVKYLENKS